MTMMMVMGNLLGIMKEIKASSVILLQVQIVMVRPGTHLTCEKIVSSCPELMSPS